MTITVGTDTYISYADAVTYATNNGLTLGATQPATETLLKNATVALDRIYGAKYLGQKETMGQPLGWPRLVGTGQPHGEGEWLYVTYDSDGNPRDFSGLQPETGYAQVELAALMQAGTDVYAQPLPTVSAFTNKVASLEESKTLANSQGWQQNPLYKISLILRPLLVISSGSIPITRGA